MFSVSPHSPQNESTHSDTISLMQDQVQRLNRCRIQSVYLGPAQYDENAEASAFDPTTNERVIFVTPEWICKPSNQAKLQSLQKTKSLARIAIDEAHLVQEWASFRSAFSELKELKHILWDTAIMALVLEPLRRYSMKSPNYSGTLLFKKYCESSKYNS